ncbi:MAG: TetR/AcrR family transcriptional regulator [Halopenitus sp.]
MGDDEPSAADEIMEGVYQALCEHGYAGLTMQDIADECSKSKSLLHYHYDTKEDLLVAFLDHIISDFETKVEESADRPATERIVQFAAWFVFEPEEVERESFHIALLELRSQGPFNDRIREQLERSDHHLRETAADIVRDGIDSGHFEPIDVDETAALLVATLDGARTRQITLGRDVLDGDAYTHTVAHAAIERVIEPILTPETTLPDLESVLESMSDSADGVADVDEADEADEAPESRTESDEESRDSTENETE